MFVKLLLLFTIIPVVELYLLIRLGSLIGAFSTILLVLGTGVLGAALARREGFAVLQTVQHRMNRGEIPADAMIDGLCILIAGVVLITPGIVTDVLGFLLLIPPTRALIKRGIARYLRDAINRSTVHVSGSVFESNRGPGPGPRPGPAGERRVENGEATFVDPTDTDPTERDQ